MNTDDLVRHYGDRKAAQKALGISRQLWRFWTKRGIPKLRKFQIQVNTNGKLKAGR